MRDLKITASSSTSSPSSSSKYKPGKSVTTANKKKKEHQVTSAEIEKSKSNVTDKPKLKKENIFMREGGERDSDQESEDDVELATLTENTDSYASDEYEELRKFDEDSSSRKERDSPDNTPDNDDDNSTSCDDDEITWRREMDSKHCSNVSGSHHKHTHKLEHKKENEDDDEEDEEYQQYQHPHHQHHQHHPSEHHKRPKDRYKEKRSQAGKPPRPAISFGSLDRRRQNPPNRKERDTKSRSSHSLKDKHLSNSKNSLIDSKEKEESSSSQGEKYHRKSPFWEPPPPPAHHWDPHNYYSCAASREELRMMEYYRRPYDPRYGSCQDLFYSQHPSTLSLQATCENNCCSQRYYQAPCCSHYQRQDNSTDQRIKRLQSDKDALELQVQVLNEQLTNQNEKIAELEKSLNEKNLLLSRVRLLENFAENVGLQIDKQKEMLARSSLETQKLELMSAMSELKLQQAALERLSVEQRAKTEALERENLELRSKYLKNSITNLNNQALFYKPRPPSGPNSPLNSNNLVSNHSNSNGNLGSKLTGSHGNLPQSLSLSHQSSPEFYRQREIHYNSLPRQSFATTTVLSVSAAGGSGSNGNLQDTPDSNNVTNGNSQNKQRNVAFADSDKIIDDSIDLPHRSYTPQAMPSPSMKHKGLRGILEKIKGGGNSNNVSLVEDLPLEGEFKRGGFRATAGPRLGWSNNAQEKPNKAFKDYNCEDLCLWFEELGLEQYNDEVRRWLKDGATELINCAPVDMEKELGLKNPLHRKKISLAVAELTGIENEELFQTAAKLDTAWILRWLDDIGLPQYKDEFMKNGVDGRMLHKLTFDDLGTLHVTSCLHVASLRRAIQVMRESNWNPECLMRRSTGDVNADREKVALWSTHCVMEWLRLVDLAEYAPNLRGAGVHGALMMYEVKFTAELLADLLSIPASKTLLRRHLATHFKELLGREIIQAKREAETTLGFQPLTITAKIKTPKKSQFSLKRKKSSNKSGADELNEFSNFVCPMGSSDEDSEPEIDTSTTKSRSSVRSCFAAKQ